MFLRGVEKSLSENENHTLIYTYTGGLTRIFKKSGDLGDIFWGCYFSCSRSQGVAALVSQSVTIVRRAGLSSWLRFFCCSSKNRFWKSGLLWLADWEWMGDGAKHFVQQNLSFQSYSWWEPSSFFSTSSFPKSSLGDDRLLLMGGRASPNTSEILQVRTLSLC